MTVRGDSRGDDSVSGMRSCASRSVEFGLKTDLHKSRVGHPFTHSENDDTELRLKRGT
jgi:hypothetical protein